MNKVLDSQPQTAQHRPLSSLTGATAANDDLLPRESHLTQAQEATGGWDSYEVWHRFIKEARDRREGLTL